MSIDEAIGPGFMSPAFGGKADILIDGLDVGFWPKADIASCTAHVRFRG